MNASTVPKTTLTTSPTHLLTTYSPTHHLVYSPPAPTHHLQPLTYSPPSPPHHLCPLTTFTPLITFTP